MDTPDFPARAGIARIIHRRHRPLTFAEFTQLALYDPKFGYYTSGQVAIGKSQHDFMTSPEGSPLFGHATARWLRDVWEELGRPKTFTIVEMGAGNGTWAKDILEAIKSEQPREMFAATKYIIVETSASLKTRQRKKLTGLPVQWHGTSATDTKLKTSSITGAIISNELPDSFPPHRLVKHGTEITERYVSVGGNGKLIEIEDDVSPKLDLLYYADIMRDGVEFPVQPMILDWMAEVGRILHRGSVLTIDYGNKAELLAVDPQNVAAYGAFEGGPEPFNYDIHNALKYPGMVDITAKANFSDIMRGGSDAGLTTITYQYQQDFLASHGFIIEMNMLYDPAARNAAARLLDPREFGNFKVLIQQKV